MYEKLFLKKKEKFYWRNRIADTKHQSQSDFYPLCDLFQHHQDSKRKRFWVYPPMCCSDYSTRVINALASCTLASSTKVQYNK